jgi:mannobiose 2-epimerase
MRIDLTTAEVENELLNNIIPFWLDFAVDDVNGGFWGRITNDLTIEKEAPKGLILNARLLWTFAAMSRVGGDDRYPDMADRAYAYLNDRFFDRENGGAFWLLDHRGEPTDDKKRIYGQAFVLYSLAEYYAATRNEEVLNLATGFFDLIVDCGLDPEYGGYFEAFTRDWELTSDQRLSDIDLNERKSMNTHLHVLEAFTTLYRVWPDRRVGQRLAELIDIFLSRIIDPETYAFRLFFDEQWRVKSDHISYGHDIEGSWLLTESAEVLENPVRLGRVQDIAVKMAQAVLNNGRDEDGGIFYESDGISIIDSDKHWWPQAEAAVGFLNAYEISGQKRFLSAAVDSWRFIQRCIVDTEHGEWFWKVDRWGVPALDIHKVSEWKSPYHNTRACLELMRRLKNIL